MKASSISKFLLMTGLVVGWTALVALSCPNVSHAQSTGLSDYLLYGVDGVTNSLVRHDFASSQTTKIGVIRDSNGNTLTGIEGITYIPGNQNLIGFWPDPADNHETKMVYINVHTARASVVGQDLGEKAILGATTVRNGAGQHNVYAIQSPKTVSFKIEDGKVIPLESFAAKVSVLGVAFEDFPVTMQARVGNVIKEPFGAYGDPDMGDVNDSSNPRSYAFPDVYPTGTPVTVGGTGWYRDKIRLKINSLDNSPNVKVLRNGDVVPDIKPFEDQATIGSFLSKYINSDTGKVTIGQNQIIYLYELWTTNFDDSTADFQDLVVMVTLAKTVEELEVTPEAGLVGGHFDVGTSTSAGDSTDAHVHEYDDKYNVLGIDAFNYHEDKLQEIDDIIGSGQLFDLILVNASLSPGAQVRINGAMGQLGNGPFTLGNSSGATRVTSLRVDFSKNAIPNGGLVPTETKLVQSNTPGPNGEYRNGALAVQVVALNADGSPAYTVGENGAATSGLLWETTLFWHTDAEAHEDDDHDNAAGKLIRVNHKTGEYESIMLLERSYDSLAAISDNAFYATADNVLYLLDPVAGTETEIGITPSSQNNSLEFAGDMLLDFSRASTALMELNEPDASLVQGPYSIGVNDLRGIVVISRSDEPRKPGSYD